MKYYSTLKPDDRVSMREAVTSCVTRDGGLYMPDHLPQVPAAFINNTSDMSLREIAYVMTDVFMGGDIDSATIKKVVDGALSFPTPMVRLTDSLYVLELFHGPSRVFKDIGAQFLADFFETLNPRDGTRLNVLVTTTGNTGASVARAFGGKDDINVFILYPHGSVSREDAAFMKASGANIFPLEVAGTIDDCRAMVASAFADRTLRDQILLTSANSTNFARLMPQVALFFYAIGRMAGHGIRPDAVDVAVPCGNLGLLTSGLLARHIGLRCHRLLAGCNANNAFDRFMTTGQIEPTKTVASFARMMDQSSPSNLPRLMALCGGDIDRLRREIAECTVDDALIARTIRDVYETTGYVADPHTAVAIASLSMRDDDTRPAVVMSTAHPDKSAEVMKAVLGSDYKPDAQKHQSMQVNFRHERLSPSYPALKKYLLSKQ